MNTKCIVLVMFFALYSVGAVIAQYSLAGTTSEPRYRPRVIYFYANWCGVCNRFGPVLKKTVSAYSNYVDFQAVNVDDPNNRRLTQRFHISSIPATYIFNSKGQAVFAKKGYADQQSIYNVLKSVYLESVASSAKDDAAKNAEHGAAGKNAKNKH